MCSLQEHSDRSARERTAQQQEAPIFAQTAKDHGFIFWPSLIPVQQFGAMRPADYQPQGHPG